MIACSCRPPKVVFVACNELSITEMVRAISVYQQVFTLHYITLHYITLHYITLHYITLHLFYGLACARNHAS
jgi:hypothetical protein